MSLKYKTLIVFDTNSLRKMRANKERDIINYTNFDFGSPFKKIKDFIIEKELTDLIQIGIPEMVLKELQHQCEKQYLKDHKSIQSAIGRISEIPNKVGMVLNDPDINFDYKVYIETKFNNVLQVHNVIKIPFDVSKTAIIFNNMLEKVLDVEDVKSPFRPKDAGFKDNIIWENLIRFNDIGNFDKIYFITKDSDYKENCYTEFNLLWPQQQIFIKKEELAVISELEILYKDVIAEKAIEKFANSDVFIENLKNNLKTKNKIQILQSDFEITGFSIINNCTKIEKLLPDENDVQSVNIYSDVLIEYNGAQGLLSQNVEAKTFLFDEVTKDIIGTDFNFELE